MKKGDSGWIAKETLIADGLTKTFQIGDGQRESIDESDIFVEFDENSSITKFFSEYGQIFLQLSEFGEGFIGLNVSSIIDRSKSKKPGDIDVAFVNKLKTELHCFEVKRIKVGKEINKLHGLKKAKKQIEGHLKYEFTSSSIVIICAVKGIVGRSGEFLNTIGEAVSEFIGFDFMKENGIGLILIEHVQTDQLSINSKELIHFSFILPPKNKTTDSELIEKIMLDSKMVRVEIPKNYKEIKLR